MIIYLIHHPRKFPSLPASSPLLFLSHQVVWILFLKLFFSSPIAKPNIQSVLRYFQNVFILFVSNLYIKKIFCPNTQLVKLIFCWLSVNNLTIFKISCHTFPVILTYPPPSFTPPIIMHLQVPTDIWHFICFPLPLGLLSFLWECSYSHLFLRIICQFL